ncbi:MAG: hypothetical protein U0794_05080 [Isosphaeraceae bacterium]
MGHGQTAGGVQFTKGRLVEVARAATQGDGVLPDALALLPGVTRVYRARGGGHWLLPTRRSVIAAVRELLAGRSPRIEPARGSGRARQTARHATGDTIGVLGVAYLRETDDDTTIPAPSAAAMPSKTMVGLSTKAANSRRPVSPPGVVTAATSASQMPELEREVSPPQSRRLRVFSFDPLLATDLDALGTDTIVLDLPWDFSDGDGLRPGPVGEYLEVVDYDPASRCFYPPVDLNHPHLLAQDGLPVSEGDPRFHQQMVYAVAMSTIAKFEEALGRVALWAPMLRRDSRGQVIPSRTPGDEYVQRLRVYPHAFRQANAYYSPEKKALLFGYFPADGSDVGRNLPGGMVFSCLSFDIIAHETTHALLDGLHRYLTEPSNPDVYAFHEAFADIVALFQHFSQPAVLWHQLARSKGDLSKESLLGALAVQFGEALGKHGALRGYLGHYDPQTRKWTPKVPDPRAITQVFEPHERGAILVAALFRAFTNIYENRVRDLRRIASGGTGELPEGDLHPDLVTRLAEEAARAAGHVLTMCIRALDYIPPIDLTFGEYLRALITADYDLVRNDDRRYRVSFLSAFRDWGIYPGDVRSLSVDNLLWQPLPIDALRDTRDFFVDARLEGWKLRSDRRDSYLQMREFSLRFNSWLREIQRSWDRSHPNGVAEWAWPLGLSLGRKAPRSILRREDDDLPIFEVHSLRPSRRIGPDGQQRTFAVVELVQRRLAYFDPVVQNRVDEHGPVLYPSDLSASAGSTAGRARRRRGALPPRPDFYFRGGSTLIIDPETGEIRYGIRKSVLSKRRLDREREFRQGAYGDRVGGIYLADDRAGRGNPFAFLHSAY